MKNPPASPKARVKVTSTDLEAARLTLNFADHRWHWARRVLVQGQSVSDVAREAGVTRQAVNQTVRAVYDHLATLRKTQQLISHDPSEIPTGWVRVTLVAPRQLVKEFRKAIAEAAAQVSPGKGERTKIR